MTDLGVLAGDVFGVAWNINDRGQIVGSSSCFVCPANEPNAHALLWENGVMTVLQRKIPANSGWTLLVASGINNRGQIDGWGIHNGNFRAFLLTPNHK